MRGDLDAITLKALEKDRSRRYATPSELAADIGRDLRNEPVLARPASATYRARKYVRRHRLGVSVAAIAVALLVSVAVAQAFELRRIKRERDRADRVTEFMTGMFQVSDPSEARGNDIRTREILDKAAKDIDAGLAKDPELQAQMMHVMGKVYLASGSTQRPSLCCVVPWKSGAARSAPETRPHCNRSTISPVRSIRRAGTSRPRS